MQQTQQGKRILKFLYRLEAAWLVLTRRHYCVFTANDKYTTYDSDFQVKHARILKQKLQDKIEQEEALFEVEEMINTTP